MTLRHRRATAIAGFALAILGTTALAGDRVIICERSKTSGIGESATFEGASAPSGNYLEGFDFGDGTGLVFVTEATASVLAQLLGTGDELDQYSCTVQVK